MAARFHLDALKIRLDIETESSSETAVDFTFHTWPTSWSSVPEETPLDRGPIKGPDVIILDEPKAEETDGFRMVSGDGFDFG